ncbi:MAG: hypothetical protein AB7P99_10180 [Vicinamibacterales bacterium]
MTIDQWLHGLGIVVPLLSALAVARMAMAKASADRDREDMATVRQRTHKLVQDMQSLPSTLRPFFVDRGEWDEAQKAGDDIHRDHSERIRALEQRR